MSLNSKLKLIKTQKTKNDKKTSFPQEQVENAIFKPILNKIMTTGNECMKYNFGAALTTKEPIIPIKIDIFPLSQETHLDQYEKN